MSWTAHRWVWRLESPLHIGAPPAGALNRCRLYVPAQAVHGAVAAELARLNGTEQGKLPDYGKLGRELGQRCRFTYLYPAEKQDEDYITWLPGYPADQQNPGSPDPGLQWWPCPAGRNAPRPARVFRRRLLDTRPSVSITPETDTAAEGLLRETECLMPWWRAPGAGAPRRVFLVGYVFLKENSFHQKLSNLSTLFLGGDTRYGLGRVVLTEDALTKTSTVFDQELDLSGKHPTIKTPCVFGHAFAGTSTMTGAQERAGGWQITKRSEDETGLLWAPGSTSTSPEWEINRWGYWTAPERADQSAESGGSGS